MRAIASSLKARNVISGWPRGKSTESLARGWEHELDCWPAFRRTDRSRAEAMENIRYHQKQEAMLYEYIERYRRLTRHGECILDPDHYIGMYGRRTKICQIFRSIDAAH